ncbi:sigma-54 dependent transcriptional regulator [Pseudomonas sp. R2.Fl]|nr:sigma-54 dependent transcriptional regulator [Pseudomonas sp. R2.Fl]
MTAHILVVNDDPAQRRQIKTAIEAQGHIVEFADQAHAALEVLRVRHDQIKVVLLDLSLDGLDHRAFLSTLAQMEIDAPVVVKTGQGGVDRAVDAMRSGAFDFIVDPVPPERIAGAIASALKFNGRDGGMRVSRRSRSGHVSFADIVSASASMTRVVDLARRAVGTTIPVILEGESGVGKELVARAIHFSSDRSGKPFVSVNCSAVAADTIETLLFGDDLGPEESGKVQAADGGTLFLDEISALPIAAQARLVRLVQNGEIDSQGGRRQRKADIRLISSTRKDLIEEVKAGRFREDLYYRLNVYPITIPALRRRRDDIPFLARAFVERFSAEQRLVRPLGISPVALALMTAYDWPGNVRQLENALYRAVILATGPELTEADFPQIAAEVPDEMLGHGERAEPLLDSGPVSQPGSHLSARDAARLSAAASNPSVLSENVIVSTDNSGNVRKLADVEEELIRFALKYYRGQMSQVARKLGIGRSTLYRKLKDYGIDPDDPQKHAA